MNVLVVAPDSSLQFARDEVLELIRELKAVPLTGIVTVRDVLAMVGSRAWDVIWFAAHGNTSHIVLSDAEGISAAQLVQDARNSGARLIVLNTCSSELIAYRVHEETGVDVICNVLAVPDIDAYRTGVYLARNLAAGYSVREAYERSKPGQNRTYLYLTDGIAMAEIPPVAGELRQQARDIAELSKNVAVLAASYARIVEDIAEIKERQSSVPVGYSALWVLSALNVLALVVFVLWMGAIH